MNYFNSRVDILDFLGGWGTIEGEMRIESFTIYLPCLATNVYEIKSPQSLSCALWCVF